MDCLFISRPRSSDEVNERLHESKRLDSTNPRIRRSMIIYQRDFLKALQRAKPTVGPEDLKKHTEFTAEFGMEG